MTDPPVSSPSRADDLAHALQLEIITGRIPLGTRLRQEDLAARFKVSRTPVREALRQLQAIGLVEQLGHRGALGPRVTAAEGRNVYLARAERAGLPPSALPAGSPATTEATSRRRRRSFAPAI